MAVMRSAVLIFIVLFFTLPVGIRVQAQSSRPAPSMPVLPTWDEEKAKGYLPYHQLTVEDFPINDKLHPDDSFWIQPFTHHYYRYLMKMARGGMVYAYVMDWTVFSGFDKNLSSRKSNFHEMSAELPYAQAYLDLNELYARSLARLEPGELPSGSGKNWEEARRQLESRVEQFCEAQYFELQKEENAFVIATDHGRDRKKLKQLSAQNRSRLVAVSHARVQATASGTPTPAASPSAASPTATPSTTATPARPGDR